MCMAMQGIFNDTSDITDFERSYIKQSSYYDIEEFKNIMNQFNTESNLSVLDINARSLVNHFDELSSILSDLPSPLDVITLQETWLDDSLSPLVSLDGYSFITKHKLKCKEGGGLGIYIKEGIDFKERKDLSCPPELQELFDYTFIEVKQNAPLKNTLIGVFYRPPGIDSVTLLTDHLKSFLPRILKENKSLVLTSDMNINLLKYNVHKPTS